VRQHQYRSAGQVDPMLGQISVHIGADRPGRVAEVVLRFEPGEGSQPDR
jgi:hypothetical protein